ncbi:MAG: folate-binding protein [Betaproteobacteria bacterium]|nr:folate-binding protein [Betaproteobacteria bacterium]
MSQEPTPASQLQGRCHLTHLGVIQAQGPDAAQFLHNQLSQDFLLLGSSYPTAARLAAFCSAKGRVQASFIAWKPAPDTVYLLCSQDLLANTLKRLSMFVLRSKVKLSDASSQFQVWGWAGDALEAACPAAIPWSTFCLQNKSSMQVQGVKLYPALGAPRALLLLPAELLSSDPPLPELLNQVPLLPNDLWLWSEVQSGVATVSAPLIDALVPQMLNYESVGGVNFKKGCYPGQEVVARSQFRGTLKRRTYLAHLDAQDLPLSIKAGDEVFDAQDPSQPCGVVVQASITPNGLDVPGWDVLVSMQNSALNGPGVHLGSATEGAMGPQLHFMPLPYRLLEDI